MTYELKPGEEVRRDKLYGWTSRGPRGIMTHKPTLTETYLSEVITYGGFPVTRATAYELAFRLLGCSHDAGWFAFAPHIRTLPGVEPMTREEVEAEMEKAKKNR